MEVNAFKVKTKVMEKWILGYGLQVVNRRKRYKQATKLGKNIEINVKNTSKYLIYTQYEGLILFFTSSNEASTVVALL